MPWKAFKKVYKPGLLKFYTCSTWKQSTSRINTCASKLNAVSAHAWRWMLLALRHQFGLCPHNNLFLLGALLKCSKMVVVHCIICTITVVQSISGLKFPPVSLLLSVTWVCTTEGHTVSLLAFLFSKTSWTVRVKFKSSNLKAVCSLHESILTPLWLCKANLNYSSLCNFMEL